MNALMGPLGSYEMHAERQPEYKAGFDRRRSKFNIADCAYKITSIKENIQRKNILHQAL